MRTAGDIALEHCAWARRAGQSPRMVMESVGVRLGYDDAPNWIDAANVIAAAWQRLRPRAGQKSDTAHVSAVRRDAAYACARSLTPDQRRARAKTAAAARWHPKIGNTLKQSVGI